MLGGYYTIASGMMTRQKEMDVIGNNLVNMQTPGYRGEKVVTSAFEQELLTRQEKYSATQLGNGKMATAAVVQGTTTLFHSGDTQPTGRALDMAINGEGFYNIEAEDGTIYLTRNGQFGLDEEGRLILPGMGTVLDDGGQEIVLESENFTVTAEGIIMAMDEDEVEEVAQLMVTVPDNMEEIVMINNGLFRLDGNAEAAETYTIEQGNLELSNINMNQELTNLIAVQRGFQSCSAALQIMDGMNRKAASQLASI